MRKILLFICCLTFWSCNNEDSFYNTTNETNEQSSVLKGKKDVNLQLKKDFGLALAKIMSENQDVRTFIRSEALKKIDHDYDVVYQLVKAEKINNGKTLEEYLSEYISKENLDKIDSQIPTLTIFVPNLGDEYFSAESWNVEKDIPVVAIRTTETNDVPIIKASGEEWVLEAQYTPISPIVVLKENERLATTNQDSTISLRSAGSGSSLYFIDEVFDNTTEKSDIKIRSGRYPDTPTPAADLNPEITKVLKSHEIFKNTNNWQRDYIYYDLTTTQTRGKVNKNIQEHIVAFELIDPKGSDDATSVINKICDQTGDPTPNGNTHYLSNCWTDGEFEFLIKCYVASTTGIGSEIKKYIRFSANDLFLPVAVSSGGGRGGVTYVSKKFWLKEKARVNLPLFEWNLETISSSIKISVEEVDSQETVKQSTSTTTEFASNFEYNFTTGQTDKVGLKFGASQKKTMTVLYDITTTKGNDELGDVIVNFGDDVITSSNYSTYNPNQFTPVLGLNDYWLDFNSKYNSGWYRIYISPKVK